MFNLRLVLMFFLVRNPFVTHQSERLILAGSGIRRQGVSYAYFAVHKFQYLQGSPLVSSCEVDKARDCALACVNNPPCSSFNLGLLLTAKGKLQCELLPEDKYRNAGKIFHSQQFHHYSIKTPCSSNPCKNSGSCFPNYEEHNYGCICAPGYTDSYCTTDIDECLSQPCLNGATCTDLVNNYNCFCQTGYRGRNCHAACLAPLGMENGEITSVQLTASSQWDGNHSPDRARLNIPAIGTYRGAWAVAPDQVNQNQWILVDLRIKTRITYVATQGRADDVQWIKKYKLQFGDDGSSFEGFKQEGENVDKVFLGNSDSGTVVTHVLIPPIKARYVRLLPVEWHNYISLRTELYGCLEEIQALGMESGAIADSQLTASSEYNAYHSTKRSRLHTKEISALARGAWVSLTNDANQWLQIDVGKVLNVTHIATQGRNTYSPFQYVTKYKVQYSNDGQTFQFYKREGQPSDEV
ncbi:unnamed protein product, partial [Porites evermanni]